jgi:transcriptional regulator with XRE-family HTH domain
MNYGQKIAELRKSKGLTQTELGAKLNITAQAVSKWENDLSEPDLDSIKKMCGIFGVSVDTFLGVETPSEKQEIAPATETVKIINGYCEKCKKPVGPGEYTITNLSYNGAKTYKVEQTKEQHIFCNDCYKTVKETKTKEDVKKVQIQKQVEKQEAKSDLKKGFIWGAVAAVAAFLFFFLCLKNNLSGNGTLITGLILWTIGGFTIVSQIIWGEFIGDVFFFFCRSFSAPFGLIFELSLDGIIWLLTVKLALWIICSLLSAIWFIIGIFVTLFMSFFSFPFGLVSKIREIHGH